MKILGIADGMTGGAALVEDGKIIYAIHEERLSRAKMATGFPRMSINKVFEDTNTRPDEIDAVAIASINEYFIEEAVAYDGWLRKEQGLLKEIMLSISSFLSSVVGGVPFFINSYYRIKSLMAGKRRKAIIHILRRDWNFKCPVEFIDHHFAHACTAYFTSGLKKATVFTMDGAGDHSSSKVYTVTDNKFKQLCNVRSFDSIGNYYAYVTHLCGFKAQRHEGKITGLAAYGKPKYVNLITRFITYENGRIINKGKVFYWSAVKKLQEALPKDFKREDLACSMQQVLEDVSCEYIREWVEKTGCGDLALAGGVFANVKLNQRIHDLDNVKSVFIYPGMGDEGLAVGAAFALGLSSGMKISSSRITNVYFGCSYSTEDIAAAIEKEGFTAEYVEEIESKIAELLAQGNVVARFNGPMEYGPRALGNRSILYQPTDPTVNDWLNKKLVRTEFMPFAPVTLEEYADQCYKNLDGGRYPAHFMTITFDCTDWMIKHCPAVVHIDGTARPQLINKESNASYYKILDEYRKLTGLSSIINTSFNMHEEPIVCTPLDAIRAFKDGHLEYLAMGNYLLSNGNKED